MKLQPGQNCDYSNYSSWLKNLSARNSNYPALVSLQVDVVAFFKMEFDFLIVTVRKKSVTIDNFKLKNIK